MEGRVLLVGITGLGPPYPSCWYLLHFSSWPGSRVSAGLGAGWTSQLQVVAPKGSSALPKSVLEALSGQTLASGHRQGSPGFQGEGICSQSGLGVKGGPSGAEHCVGEGEAGRPGRPSEL